MELDLELLTAQATESGFRVETLEKVARLGSLLADASRHPLLSDALVLKGGTALNLFFGLPRRLSVDLDFNYIGSLGRNQMLRERPEVERALETIAGAQGYSIQRSSDEHAGRKLYLGYTSVRGSRDRIEVDIDYQFRQPLLQPALLRMWQPGNLERPSAMVVAFEEPAAGKLCAFLDRCAARDVYDVMHLPSLREARWEAQELRPIFVGLAGMLPHPLHSYCEDRLARVTESVVSRELLPMLSREQSIGAPELRQRAWDVARPLLELTEAEREYTDLIQNGELRPELLFPKDEQMAQRLRDHPALLWKAQNARAHGKQPR